ncbi:YjbH domain-containing protein [Shigella flexneri]
MKGNRALTIATTIRYRYYSCVRGAVPLGGDDAALHRRVYKTVQQRGCLLRRPDYKDKAFDVSLRLVGRELWMPQVSVGAKDIGGTALFDGGRTLLASKARDRLISTLVWGGLSPHQRTVKNPSAPTALDTATVITATRKPVPSTATNMFHGPASLFFRWRRVPNAMAAVAPVSLEYEGNNYSEDFVGKIEQKSKFKCRRHLPRHRLVLR